MVDGAHIIFGDTKGGGDRELYRREGRRPFRISLFLTCTNRNSRQLTLLLTEGKEVIPRRKNKENPKIPKAK